MSMKKLGRALLCVLVLVTVPATFGAMPEKGDWSFGFYAGNYALGADDVFDDQGTFGLRAGRMMTNRWGIGASIGAVSPDEKPFSDPTLSGELDAKFLLVDVNVMVAFRAKKRVNMFLGGGLGGAIVSTDGQVTGTGGTVFFEDLTKDSLTAHVGTGMIIALSKKVFLRPMVKYRWFEAREAEEIDQEVSLGVGFRF